MASPQLENGFTSIANEIMDALGRIRIPGEARQVLDIIFRKTYGWHRVAQAISLSQFVEATGQKKANVIRSIKMLESMRLIVVERDGYQKRYQGGIKTDTLQASTYQFNKDYDTWKPVSEVVSEAIPQGYQKRYQGGIKTDNNSVSKAIPPSFKDNLKKEDTIVSYSSELENPSSEESETPQENFIFKIPLIDKTKFGITQDDIDQWQDVFPAVNVISELKRIALWCDDNPKNRKTRRGVRKFCSSWMERSQNKARNGNVFKPKQNNGEELKRMMEECNE